MAMEMGLDQIISEGDFKVLIKVLKSGVNHFAHFGHIAYVIHYIASSFATLCFSHIHRHCNKVAHLLAR